jgi:hypothetical protein
MATSRPPAASSDTDPSKWERRHTEDVDPWGFGFFLPLLDAASEQRYIFSTATQGGRDALADLQEAYVGRDGDTLPVVALSQATTTTAHTVKWKRCASRSSDGWIRLASRSGRPRRRS